MAILFVFAFQASYWLMIQFVFIFDWPVAVCHCNGDRKLGLSVDDDWQVVVSSSSSIFIQWTHCDWLITCASIGSDLWDHNFSLSLKVSTLNFESKYLGYNWFFLVLRVRHDITAFCVQLPAIFLFLWYRQRRLEAIKVYLC